MNSIIALLVGLTVLAVVYNRYLIGSLNSRLALPLVASISFVNVILATSIVVPFDSVFFLSQLIAALVVSLGSTFGAYKAKMRAEAGMTEYRRCKNSLPDQ